MGYNAVADSIGLSSFVYLYCCLPNLRNRARFRENSNL